MRLVVMTIAAAALVAPGCATSRFVEADSAERQIASAEDAGADAREIESLRIAKHSIEDAREAEARAEEDLNGARRALDDAKARKADAVVRHTRKTGELERVEGSLTSSEERLKGVEERERNLRLRGLSEEEAFNAAGTQVTLEKLRVEGLMASRTTLKKEIHLFDLEMQDADVHIKAAQARIDSAEQRLKVARALYETAEQQAKIAEAEAIAAERLAINTRLQDGGM
jgi:chromosome segregation ATPase